MWSLLADDAKRLNLQGVVPAFHRHAHNCLCQVEHHSKYKVGAGKENFKTCEWVFSGSNALAGNIRNATDFHRHQALDEHFGSKIWIDMLRYVSHLSWEGHFANEYLVDFIYHNYVQSLNLISMTTSFIINFWTSHATTPFKDDLQDEFLYLKHLVHKKDGTSTEVDYMKALIEYEEAQQVSVFFFHTLQHLIMYSGPVMKWHVWSLASLICTPILQQKTLQSHTGTTLILLPSMIRSLKLSWITNGRCHWMCDGEKTTLSAWRHNHTSHTVFITRQLMMLNIW
jgi:hypothetical protein